MLRKTFQSISALIFVISLTAFSGTISAETKEKAPFQIEQMNIQVLPEYSFHPEDEDKEQPPLLFGYHLTLINTSDVPQKAHIEFPLPFEEQGFKLNAVGEYSNDQEEIKEIQYKFDEKTGVISWETMEEVDPQGIYKYVIEFYTNSIQESGDTKTFSYHFKSFSDIGAINLTFVEPLMTDSFTLEPAPEKHQQNSMNINLYTYTLEGMKSGEEKTFQLNYERKESRTTSDLLLAMADSDYHHGTTVKSVHKIPGWKIAIVVGGIALIAAAILIVILQSRSKKLNVNEEEKNKNASKADVRRSQLRSMLLEGRITDKEYRELIKKYGGREQDE